MNWPALGVYVVFVVFGVTQNRAYLLWAAGVAVFQIGWALAQGWRPWPRTNKEVTK